MIKLYIIFMDEEKGMKNEYLKLIGKKVLELNENEPNNMELGKDIREFLHDKFSNDELYSKKEEDS